MTTKTNKSNEGRSKKRSQAIPRLHTPLIKGNTLVNEVKELAERINMPLMPWQEWVLDDMLKIDNEGNFRRKTCGLLVARQP